MCVWPEGSISNANGTDILVISMYRSNSIHLSVKQDLMTHITLYTHFHELFVFLFIFYLNSTCFLSLSPARSIPQWIYGLTIQSFIRFSLCLLTFMRFFTVHFSGAYVPFCPFIHIQHVWHMYWHQWNRYVFFCGREKKST